MDKKFIKISVSMVAIVIVFISINKLIFKDLIHEEDDSIFNYTNIEVTLDNKYISEDGIKLKFKVKNDSKYTFRIDESYLDFEMYQSGNKDMIVPSGIKIYPTNIYEGNGVNDRILMKGIDPHKSEYITFTIPKGFGLDNEYFPLDSIGYRLNGQFVVRIQFLESGYITVKPNYNIGGSLSEVYLKELDIK